MCKENDIMKWEFALTNKQREELLKATIESLEKLLSLPEVKDINEGILIPIGKSDSGEKIVLTNEGLRYASSDNRVYGEVEKEKWPREIKEYKVNTSRVEEVIFLITRPLRKKIKKTSQKTRRN